MSTSYLNAPATLLLATACACCGRKIVDAVSIETGMGPDCRADYGVTFEVGNAAHDEANVLVHRVAQKGMTRKLAAPIFLRLAELGFAHLAEKIANRFKTTLEVPKPSEAEVAAHRAEYASIRADFVHSACITPAAFNGFVGTQNTPADYVAAAKALEVTCPACRGSGAYHGHHSGGDCFRCAGKGTQALEDAKRNRAYDALRGRRAA
jgi:hypothetical protein